MAKILKIKKDLIPVKIQKVFYEKYIKKTFVDCHNLRLYDIGIDILIDSTDLRYLKLFQYLLNQIK